MVSIEGKPLFPLYLELKSLAFDAKGNIKQIPINSWKKISPIINGWPSDSENRVHIYLLIYSYFLEKGGAILQDGCILSPEKKNMHLPFDITVTDDKTGLRVVVNKLPTELQVIIAIYVQTICPSLVL